MNSLSWMIYFASVVGNVQGFLGFATFAIAAVIGGVALFMTMESESVVKSAPFLRKYIWLPIVSGLVATLIPSSQTIYLIAASEAGETVITNPETIEMMTDLKAIIKKRLAAELAE